MARRKRYYLPGATYHVMIRGNAGEVIFDTDHDRCKMSLLIQEGVERYGHRLLAYCFMGNHVHLAIQVGQASISQIMQNLSFRYTRHINRSRKRIGHLFQGRFKSIMVDSECYLKELVRYIHLNPVRAGIVELPNQYRWSSHNTYLGNDQIVWISHHNVLKRFGDNIHSATARFNSFVLEGVGQHNEIDFKKGSEDGILGDDSFVQMVREYAQVNSELTSNLADIVRAICEHYNIDHYGLIKSGKDRKSTHVRSMLALLVRESNDVTLEELGDLIGREASGLSKLASRLNAKSLLSVELQGEIKEVKSYLAKMSECQA